MKRVESSAVVDAGDEIPALIELLLRTEKRLEQLTAGEVDSVSDSHGRTFLLRRAQDKLRRSDAMRQTAVLNALPAHIALLDSQGNVVSVNEAWRRFAGAHVLQGPGSAIGLNYLHTCNSAAAEGSVEARDVSAGIEAVLGGREPTFSVEYACESRGQPRWFLLTVTPLTAGRPGGAVVVHADITGGKLAAEALRSSLEEFRTLAEAMPQMVWITRPDGWNVYFNQQWVTYTGLTLEESFGHGWARPFHPDDRQAAMDAWQYATATVRPYSIECRLRRSDGVYRWWLIRGVPVADAAGTILKWFGTCTDIHDLKLAVTVRNDAERRLLESAEEYRLLFDSNPHPMWVFDAETLAFLAVNDAAVALYGFSREEFLGMTILGIRAPEQVASLLEYIPTMPDSPGLVATHVHHRKKDGTDLEVEGVSNPIEFGGRRARLVMASDVSAKRLLEAQLLQSQKMEAVGRLAGGVAHDFNNSLGVILGYTEVLMRQAAPDQLPRLEQILKATHRASHLTRQLLAFSRKQIVDPKVIDLNALLADMEDMLRRLIGEHIALVIVPGADLGQAKADPGQLEQVVMNLCVNARDAMPAGGLLRIETTNVQMDATPAEGRESIAPGRYTVLSVSDTGSGIPTDILSKIFEPFFTTKDQGKGTGLGLAMVYGIVKQAGGYAWVHSEVGVGTTFHIGLPRIDEPVAVAGEEPALPARGSETILLVEDEEALRAIAREILDEHGYRVLEAAGPKEALEMAAAHPEHIDLLVTDVVMPLMNGRALADALLVARPGLRVLFISGYTDDVIAHSGVLEADTLMLEKPFTTVAFLSRVRETLGLGR
jgi:two-component system, cell cycle sensor histidine kinase and response regulator CckA